MKQKQKHKQSLAPADRLARNEAIVRDRRAGQSFGQLAKKYDMTRQNVHSIYNRWQQHYPA